MMYIWIIRHYFSCLSVLSADFLKCLSATFGYVSCQFITLANNLAVNSSLLANYLEC